MLVREILENQLLLLWSIQKICVVKEEDKQLLFKITLNFDWSFDYVLSLNLTSPPKNFN